MLSFGQRVSLAWRALTGQRPAPTAQKTYSGSNMLSAIFGGRHNRDLTDDPHGMAQAYAAMTGVQRANNYWQKWLGGLTWHIYDGRTDEILASSTDRTPPSGSGVMLYLAITRFPELSKHGFFKSIAFSDWLYGVTYLKRLKNKVADSDFQWLNPLAVTLDIREGEIKNYLYSAPDGYQSIPEQEVAYRIAHRSPLDDLRGQPPVLSALDEMNINRNAKRALRNYYAQGMILGGIISPDDEMNVIEKGTLDDLKKEMRINHQGVDNAFRWFLSDMRVRVDQFETIDIEKNYGIIEPLRNETMMALGVPPVLAGDPTQVNYDNADKVQRNWWQAEGIPYAKEVAESFVNGQLLPFIEPDSDVYFGFDFAPFLIQAPEIITADMGAGYISIATAQEKRGYEADKDLRDIYVIAGRPMHKDVIVQLANQTPEGASIASDGVDAGDNNAPATDQPAFNEDGVAIPKGEVFGYHFDAGVVDVNEARATLRLPPKRIEEVSQLQDLQSKLAVMVTAASAGIPPEISAAMVGLDIPAPAQLPTLPPTGEPDSEKSVKALEDERPAFAYIPLANNLDVLRIQRELKKQLTDESIVWEAAPTLHVTLCFAGIMDDKAIEKLSTLIHLEALELQPALDEPIAYFETPDGKALHIALQPNSPLDAIQANVYSAFETEGHDLSEFSLPANWNPHITLAYVPDDIDLDNLDKDGTFPSFAIQADTVIVGRDDYDPVLILTAPDHVKHGLNHALESVETWRGGWTPDKARKELAIWQRKVKAGNGHSFTPEYTRGDIADTIMTAYADGADIEATFDAAFELVLLDGLDTLKTAFVDFMDAVLQDDTVAATKTLQSIRLDFEGAFEDVLAGIRSGEIDNRRRAGNILRQIIRTFGARAYRQGLADGGVMDDPTDEEQAEIAALRSEHSAFVSGITQVLIREDGITDAQAAGRPEMWFRGSIMPFYNAGLASANANGMFEWVLGATEEHCPDCPRLDGQRHRRRTWRARNLEAGTVGQATVCAGYECKCKLVPTSAKARGNF